MAAILRSKLNLTPMICRTIFSTAVPQQKMMADPLEHATGREKKELLARLAGNDNPFDMRVYKRGPGTKANPNLIPSVYQQRMIGCICEDDSTYINYMWLDMGEPKRCECGYWFKLVETKQLC